MSVNKVTLLGRLGQDPDVKMTQGGQQVATISVATSETWMKDGKKEEKTEWHRCVAWGKTAEIIGKYLKKGREVYIEGKLQTRSWDDQAGVKRYTTEIIIREVKFIGGQKDGGASSQDVPPPASPDGSSSSYGSDDDVPF